MNRISNLFKSKKQIELENLDRERILRNKIEEEFRLSQETIRKQKEEDDRIRKEVEERIINDKMESLIPWYEPIIGSENCIFVHEKYRWNPAFIKDLIKKGHKGSTESEIFQSYINQLEEDDKQRIIEEERNKKRLSSDPWVEVIGENIDAEGRIEIQLDWNDAFVKYLRTNGFRGATDDILVQAWLAALERDTSNGEYF